MAKRPNFVKLESWKKKEKVWQKKYWIKQGFKQEFSKMDISQRFKNA